MAALFRGGRIYKSISVVPLRGVTLSASRNLIEIKSEADFKEKVLGSKKPVVVDFHAEYVRHW